MAILWRKLTIKPKIIIGQWFSNKLFTSIEELNDFYGIVKTTKSQLLMVAENFNIEYWDNNFPYDEGFNEIEDQIPDWLK